MEPVMANPQQSDEYKQKFRPEADATIDREVEAALAEVPVEQLYGFDKPREQAEGQQQPAADAGAGRRGKVISIGRDDVFVDLGGKSQGVAPLSHFDTVKIGDEFEFIVDRYDEREGLLILSRKGVVSTNVSWETLEVGQVVEGTVTGMNKGGLELDVKNMRAFMPAGQVDLYFMKDISTFLGQRITAEVMQFDRNARNLILSRRALLERQKEEARQKLLAEIAEGQNRRGIVRSVTDYGAFVDLGGVDGLLHVSEMSHRRGRHPSEFVKVGDLVDVKVIKLDKETGKMSLSLKQAMPDPWANVENRYPVGTSVTGRVVRVEAFGAFVEVEEGLEGLLPISEISWQRIRHTSDAVKVGDTIKLVVIALDAGHQRITFSLKQAGPNPWAQVKEKFTVDTVVSGKVTRVVDFGAFVELEPGLEGLVHISELADQRVKSAGDVVKPGQEVQVRIMEIDKDARRMSLSIRRAKEPVKPLASTPAPAAPAKAKKKNKPELRGGLDWNW